MTSSDRPTRARYAILALLCVLAMITYMDRAANGSAKAAIMAGFPAKNVVAVQSNEKFQLRVDRLKEVEMILLAVTLLVLLLEGLYVFRPAVREIRKTITELVTAKGHLDNTVQALRSIAGVSSE